MEDTRNVIDKYKGHSMKEIVADLDANGAELEIAIDNVERDFNMGTIVRSANAFGVRHVHVIGRRQWNKRGAMMTDKYLHVQYHESVAAFTETVKGKKIVAVDNVAGSVPLSSVKFPREAVLVFGAEGPGIRPEVLAIADQIVAIEQFGSTRSLNVGVAAGVAMYAWVRENVLSQNAK
jgi:tRNA G18 (ribose-2'-O)-methylase SpoU